MMDNLSIGQLARAAGVTVETLRFYEKRGLLAAPRRRRNGYRQYSPEAVTRVQFIRHAKQVGFTLRDVSELLTMRQDRKTSCADIRAVRPTKLTRSS